MLEPGSVKGSVLASIDCQQIYFEQNIFRLSYFCLKCQTVQILLEICFIIITNLVLFSIVLLEIRPGKLKNDF